MSRRRFDQKTRAIFNEIQMKISQVNGQLLNPKLAKKDELLTKKKDLKDKMKGLKTEFYVKSSERLLSEISALEARISSFDVSKIIKS